MMADCVEWACSYVVFFSVSALLSVVSSFVNVRILVSSLRKRFATKVSNGNQIPANPIERNGSALKRTKSMDELKEELEANKFVRWQRYCSMLLGVFEVIS